ncbi:GNAT family N-acetyltransferase [Lentibacillus amyloliquefaciens]|uniref:N-acetyltransferase domain-containing protein n=1 Tax=Lentibacillus amyloliquefaciens TaxID=1472767 RepID=A0A0U4FCV4_9BACI|nr:GNAT family N-acetyltransferase [Lentibacillus amyloliquefaciens]ALX48285.1 hypothetical protein AOX59_06490 [Lentibacillus amyloliquefaciens]
MFTIPDVKFLDGTPNYFVVENIGQVSSESYFEKLLYEMMEYVTKENIHSVTIVLENNEASNANYLDLLERYGFVQHDIQYFYKRDLTSLEELYEKEAIGLKQIDKATTKLFKEVWQRVASESLNASSSLSIEKEFEGMKSELGSEYIQSCFIAYDDKTPIGITMPHIEPGTVDEGRLFYFGVVPEYHKKSLGTKLHKLSLHMLKEIGANYYVGATGHKNTPMQRIFQVNGCRMIDKKITYKLKSHID